MGAALVLFFGWQIPVRFEQGGEFAGGCLLIVLGLIVGWLTVSGRLYVHAHACHADGPDRALTATGTCTSAGSTRIDRRCTPCCLA